MRKVLVRTASGIVYIALMVAAVLTPWVAAPLAIFFVIVGLYEFYKLCKDPTLRPSFAFWLVSAFCVIACFLNFEILKFEGSPSIPWLLLLCIAFVSIFIPELIQNRDSSMSRMGLGFLGQMWIVLPLCVLFLIWIPQAPEQVLAFFIIIWMSDTAAYVMGSLFGKHKIAEKISPGKTWEGFLGSCAITVLLAWVLSLIPYFQATGFTLWQWIVLALLTEIFGLVGDLIESLFKRKAGVKDSGNLIPGHGGVLDRLDSILFATLPVYAFCLAIGF